MAVTFDRSNPLYPTIDRWFLTHSTSFSMGSKFDDSSVLMDGHELSNNMAAFKRAGYYLDSVKDVQGHNTRLLIFKHKSGPCRSDPLAAVLGVNEGRAFLVKKECIVCGDTRVTWCKQCHAAAYCSDQCRLEDSFNHPEWCQSPHEDLMSFKAGIDKVREAIYKHKLYNSMVERWITPNAEGYCGYAHWSWKKMKQELEGDGVHFDV